MTTLASLRILLGLESGSVKGSANTVRGDLRGIQAEANTTQTALSKIGAGAAPAFASIQHAALDTAKTLGVAFGAFKVGEFVGEAIKAAQDEEAGISRLNASLKANVSSREDASAAIDRQIQANEDLGFADDATRDSLTGLAAATHDVNEALRVQNTAMDLARFKHISLQEASDALVKVEGGRFRLLAGLGIQLQANATKEQALAAVQAIAAGQAEDFANTTAGAGEAAAAAFHDAEEELGTALLPLIKEAALVMKNDFAPAVEEGAGVIVAFVKAGNDLADILNKIEKAATDTGVGIHDAIVGPRQNDAQKAGQQIALKAMQDYSAALRVVDVALADGTITQEEAAAATQAAGDAYRLATVGAAAAAKANGTVTDTLRIQSDTALTAAESARSYAGGMDAAARAALALTIAVGTATGASDDQKQAAKEAEAAFKALGTVFDGFNSVVVMSAAASDQFGFANRAAMDLASEGMQGAYKNANDLHDTINTLGVAAGGELAAAWKTYANATDDASEALALISVRAAVAAQNLDAVARSQANANNVTNPNLGHLGETGFTGPTVQPFESTIPIIDPGVVAFNAAQAAAAKAAAAEAKRQAEQNAREAKAAAEKAAAEQAAAYRDRLGAAFDAVRHAAETYFAKLHDLNLQAIKDAHDHANALLDAQKAANTAPVTEAQAAQAAIVQQRELAARQAALAAAQAEEVGTGSGQVSADQKAQDILAATQALADFNAQARITALQANADAANAAIDVQKAANDQLAADATKAENDRAQAQSAAFANDLQALEASLSKHPETWAKTQQEILKLLMGYGVDYKKAAQNLGDQFAAGLLSSTRAAEEAAAALANAAGGKLGAPPKPVGAAASVGAGLGEGITVNLGPITLQVDGEDITTIIERHMSARFNRVGSGIGG